MNITNLILVGSGSICERFVREEKADLIRDGRRLPIKQHRSASEQIYVHVGLKTLNN